MQSLYLEACGDNAKLHEFHKEILEEDVTNDAILKRQVRVKHFMQTHCVNWHYSVSPVQTFRLKAQAFHAHCESMIASAIFTCML